MDSASLLLGVEVNWNTRTRMGKKEIALNETSNVEK